MSISNYAEVEILDHVLGTTAFTMPTQVYLALHTEDPTEAGSTGEVTGGSYARQSVDFAAASAGSAPSSADAEFASMPAVTVTHVSLWDASTAGNCLWTGALSASKTLNSGDTFAILSGSLTVSLD